MKRINWGVIALQMAVIGLVALVLNHPAQAQEVLAGVGLNFDIAGFIGGGTALGVAAFSTDEFEAKVLKGVQAFSGKADELSGAMKTLQEELTKVKRVANDQQANFDKTLVTLRKIEGQQRTDTKALFGDPVKRIVEDERMNLRVNAIARKMVKAPMSDAHRDALKDIVGKAGLGEDTSPGSTIIDDELSREVYHSLAMNGKWNTLAVRPMGTKQTKFAVKTARPVAVVLLTEADTIPDDANKAGTSVTAEAELIACLLNVSIQLLEDTEIDLSADLLEDFTEAFNLRLDYLAFRADGSADSTNGGMTGLFNFGTAAVAAGGNTTIENLDLDDFLRCLTTVDSAVLTRKAKWWLHPHALARALAIRDGNGRPIFQTALEAPAFGGVGSILGYPVEMVDQAPSTNAANSKVAAFGDPGAYAVGLRRVFAFESSDHHKWNTFQRSFRGTGRAGTKGRKASALSVLTTAAA